MLLFNKLVVADLIFCINWKIVLSNVWASISHLIFLFVIVLVLFIRYVYKFLIYIIFSIRII